MRPSLALLPGVLMLSVACGSESPPAARPEAPPEPSVRTLDATGAFLFAPITEAQAGGYFVLHNRGERADTLVEVSADWAAKGMMHETREAGGRVRMTHRAHLPVPARDSVVLQPGGIHVMLVQLSRMPVAGDTVALLLHFTSGANLRVMTPVVAYGQAP